MEHVVSSVCGSTISCNITNFNRSPEHRSSPKTARRRPAWLRDLVLWSTFQPRAGSVPREAGARTKRVKKTSHSAEFQDTQRGRRGFQHVSTKTGENGVSERTIPKSSCVTHVLLFINGDQPSPACTSDVPALLTSSKHQDPVERTPIRPTGHLRAGRRAPSFLPPFQERESCGVSIWRRGRGVGGALKGDP